MSEESSSYRRTTGVGRSFHGTYFFCLGSNLARHAGVSATDRPSAWSRLRLIVYSTS